jgi:nucleotide-binding universal stress UspA family protein
MLARLRGRMSYRTILMPILGDEIDAYLVRPALDLAKAFGSHVSALYVKPDPTDAIAQINRELPARAALSTSSLCSVSRTDLDLTQIISGPAGVYSRRQQPRSRCT